jgi:hypothetical protein
VVDITEDEDENGRRRNEREIQTFFHPEFKHVGHSQISAERDTAKTYN